MMDETPAEETAETPPPIESSPIGTWRLVSLIPDDGREPSAAAGDAEARATWAAISAPWHPAILAAASRLPEIEDVDSPSSAGPDEIRLIASGHEGRLPSGYRTASADIGAILLEGDEDRASCVRRIVERIDPETSLGEPDDPLALDFQALGTLRWFLRDLTIGMGHADCLDAESLAREALAGARAWRSGDRTAASSHLRASFELLTQAREKFYPVDAYIVDLCLLDPGLPAGALADPLESRAPVSFLASARAIESMAGRDPEQIALLREAIDEGRADVIGATYDESDEPFLPVESILWQFRKGAETYRKHLDERNVETLAQRRFALYPQRPQVARRFGFRFALHLAFDAGRFPVRVETKRLWDSPDGTSLEALTRPPLGGDRPSQGLFVAWRLARSMKDDHVATLPLVHWPAPVADWYRDWRRSAVYSPVLARWATLGDYFGFTDRPYESFRPTLDDYRTPYLSQAVARGDLAPVSARVEHARLRGRVDALFCLRALSVLLAPDSGAIASEEGPEATIEDALELGRTEEARLAIESRVADLQAELAQIIVGAEASDRDGYLIFNPLGITRRAPVLLPDAAPDLRPEGPLRVAQFTDEGVWAVVDLPAFGYAWVPKASTPDISATLRNDLSARGRTLRNESIEIEIDEATGGLRSIRAVGESTPRIGQQLVISGLVGPDGQAAFSKMRAESFEVDYAGPALIQAESRGTLRDPSDDRVLASFRQRFRLWAGRPVLEIDVQLDAIDPGWLGRVASSDPWASFLSCRWAWPDANSTLRRSSLLGLEPTEAERPETPDVLDISTRRQRTALLFGGLAHHRRHGPRMLDTILIAGRESSRHFRFGLTLDQDHPIHSALDLFGPVLVAPVAGPPRTGPAGWFFHLDARGVSVTRVESLPDAGDGRGWSLVFHLLETAGHSSRLRLRLVRPPTTARQTDLQGETLFDLPIEDDAVLVDLTPHELARIAVSFG